MVDQRKSEKHEAARVSLPEELRDTFDHLAEDYQFAASVLHGSPFVSYVILAELVKAGWRLTGKPIENWAKSKGQDKPVLK